MPNIGQMLKEEIARLAKKQVKKAGRTSKAKTTPKKTAKE